MRDLNASVLQQLGTIAATDTELTDTIHLLLSQVENIVRVTDTILVRLGFHHLLLQLGVKLALSLLQQEALQAN